MSMFGKTNIWGKPNGYREPDWVVRQRRDARESERIRKQLERERKADERKRKAAEREREKAMRAASRSASSSTTRGSYNSSYSTNGYHSSSSFTPSSGYNSTQNASSTENGCIEAFVNFAFVAIGIAAIILPFVWDFWTLFKVIFVIGGIFSISIPFIAKGDKK